MVSWLRACASVRSVLLMTMSRLPVNLVCFWLHLRSYPVAPLYVTLTLLVSIRVVVVDGVRLMMSPELRLTCYVDCKVCTVAAPFVLVGLMSRLT